MDCSNFRPAVGYMTHSTLLSSPWDRPNCFTSVQRFHVIEPSASICLPFSLLLKALIGLSALPLSLVAWANRGRYLWETWGLLTIVVEEAVEERKSICLLPLTLYLMASLRLFFPIRAAHGVQSCRSTQESRLVRICKKKLSMVATDQSAFIDHANILSTVFSIVHISSPVLKLESIISFLNFLCISSRFRMFNLIDRCMYRWIDRKADCFAVSSPQLCFVLFSSIHFLLTDWCGALLPRLKQELLSSSYSLPRSTSPQRALGCSYKCYGEVGQATREHLSPHQRNPHRSQTSDQTKCRRSLIIQHCLLIQKWGLAQMVMVNLQKLQSIHNGNARFFTKNQKIWSHHSCFLAQKDLSSFSWQDVYSINL